MMSINTGLVIRFVSELDEARTGEQRHAGFVQLCFLLLSHVFRLNTVRKDLEIIKRIFIAQSCEREQKENNLPKIWCFRKFKCFKKFRVDAQNIYLESEQR